VVAKVSEEINLASPKSDTFITREAGTLEEYKRFSGYSIGVISNILNRYEEIEWHMTNYN